MLGFLGSFVLEQRVGQRHLDNNRRQFLKGKGPSESVSGESLMANAVQRIKIFKSLYQRLLGYLHNTLFHTRSVMSWA